MPAYRVYTSSMRTFDCLRNLDHSCARRCGGHTVIEQIPSGRGTMNYCPLGPECRGRKV
jgi:hypothetical protein